MTWFESLEDLQKLTGLTSDELWDAGFNLDDWDFGIRVNKPLHREPTKEDFEEYDCQYGDVLFLVDGRKEGYWLFTRMLDWCVGPSYVKLGRWHYYLQHHT